MIRQQSADEQLFYTHQEMARPASGNFYMRLNRAVGDWQKLAEPFAEAFSAGVGRPTDPVVYLKVFLVGYAENITYDTDLAERISDSIAIRGFLGYSLSERTPDHSSISRNRGLIAERCRIEDVLSRAVELCEKKGLIDGELSAVDSSLIPANASLSSLRSVKTGKRVADHLREVAEKNKAEGEEGEQKKQAVSNDEFRSSTDPDARIAKKPGQKRDMCYKGTHVTEGKNGVILAAGASHADEGEVEAAIPVIEEAQANLMGCGMSLDKVTADAGYGSADFHAYLEGLGATPVTNWRSDSIKKPDGFKKESFLYYEEANCYICPAGSILRYGSFCRSTGLFLYYSDPRVCAGCENRCKCIDGKRHVRTVSRHPNEASRERNIARGHTEEGRVILRKRKHIVEPPFGRMKTYGGLGLINCRGKGKAHVKVTMAAVAHNLAKVVAADTLAVLVNAYNRGICVVQDGLRALLKALGGLQPRRLAMSRTPVMETQNAGISALLR